MRRVLYLILVVVLAAPLLLLAVLSLSRHWRWPALLPQAWQATQWHWVLHSGLGAAAVRSLLMALGVGIAATALAFPVSRTVAGHRRRGHLLTLAHLPFAVSPVVLGVGLYYIFLRAHLAGHAAGVMLAQWIFAFGYAVILLTGFWNARADALAGVASTLGASRRQIWMRVWLPLALPMLAVCLFQTFLVSWFDYPLALLIGDGQVKTLMVKLFQYMRSADTRLAATCAVLLIVPPLLALVLNLHLLPAGVAAQLESGDGAD